MARIVSVGRSVNEGPMGSLSYDNYTRIQARTDPFGACGTQDSVWKNDEPGVTMTPGFDTLH